MFPVSLMAAVCLLGLVGVQALDTALGLLIDAIEDRDSQ